MTGFSQPARGHLAMLAFSALVAGSFSLGVLAAPLIDPGALAVVRFILAGVLVGAAAVATTASEVGWKASAGPNQAAAATSS